MERAFIVSKEMGYGKSLKEYYELVNKQYELGIDFFKTHNIESTQYHIGGDGLCNCAFDEYDKTDIYLAIVPTKNDLHNFKNVLGKEMQQGLRYFRKNCKLMKEFQQYCIDNKIIINLNKPDTRDYFKSMGWARVNFSRFPCEEGYYLKVSNEYLKEDDIPEGMTPIKLSEFYIKLEEFKEKEGEE